MTDCLSNNLLSSLLSLPLMRTKATPAHLPPHHSQHASKSATTQPHYPHNSPIPLCPTWLLTHPLPQLHHLHLDTATCHYYNQCHLDPTTMPPFVGTSATLFHPPSYALQAHIGPAALQLR